MLNYEKIILKDKMGDYDLWIKSSPYLMEKLNIKNQNRMIQSLLKDVRRLELSFDPTENQNVMFSIIWMMIHGIEILLELEEDEYFKEYLLEKYKVDLDEIEYDLKKTLFRLKKLEYKL